MNIINKVSSENVPKWGNQKKYIAVHYLGVDGQNNKVSEGGYGAHYYIYWDGTIYQAADHDAILWQVGTGGYYTQKHPEARNSNTIGIEMCCKCDGDASEAGNEWYFTKETQEACVQLVRYLMEKENIPADHVLRHYDIVNKTCPAPYVHNNKYRDTWTWDEFKARLTGGVAPVQPEKPTAGKKDKIAEDGIWGPATTRKLQQIFGTLEDGKISNQLSVYKGICRGIQSATIAWSGKKKGGSALIKAMQKEIGEKQDGYIGPKFIRGWQKKLGTPVDGKLDKPSALVKALQNWANQRA